MRTLCVCVQNNPNQISWQWVKVETSSDDERFQTFLDTSQYTRDGILRSEAVRCPVVAVCACWRRGGGKCGGEGSREMGEMVACNKLSRQETMVMQCTQLPPTTRR